jgi:adenylate cyclase
VVGDVVNVAERLEELARTATAADEEVSILIGSSTAERLEPNEFWLYPLGAHAVRGRREPLEVFQLRLGPGDSAPPPA